MASSKMKTLLIFKYLNQFSDEDNTSIVVIESINLANQLKEELK